MSDKTHIGKECKQYLKSLRYLKSGRCVACAHFQYKKWAENNKDFIKQKTYNRYYGDKEKARRENSTWQRKNAVKLSEKARKRYEKDPDKVRAINRKSWNKNKDANNAKKRKSQRKTQLKQYGLTVEDYSRLLESQGGGCAICRRSPLPTEKSFPVDHCHETGKIRGVLCGPCNRGLGLFKDSPEIVAKASLYLERAREED